MTGFEPVFDWGHQPVLKYNPTIEEKEFYNRYQRLREKASELRKRAQTNATRWYESRWGGWKKVLSGGIDAIRERDGMLSYVHSLQNGPLYFINMHYHLDNDGNVVDMKLCAATDISLFIPHPNITIMHDCDIWDWKNMQIPEDVNK